MKKNIKSLRGMYDLYHPKIDQWIYIENLIKKILNSYGYNEIRFPILENTELFNHIIGNNTDVVNKEMYTFNDKSNNSITLRPEGTSSCIRSIYENNLYKNNKLLKLWYYGSMFRYERPQEGRYRQFNQIGGESFGINGPEIELEIILMINRIFKLLGLSKELILEINNLGNIETRLKYNEILITYIKKTIFVNYNFNNFIKNIISNPLKFFDKNNNNKKLKIILKNAPKLIDYLDNESKVHFDILCTMLNSLGIKFKINYYLVRGLNYYNGTVFEWKIKNEKKKSTICAGGRYNTLILKNLKKNNKQLTGVGFAIGMERLMLLINKKNPSFIFIRNPIHIIFIIDKEDSLCKIEAFKLVEQIKDNIDYIKIIILYEIKKLKKNLSYANKIDCILALIFQKKEINKNIIIIKDLEKNIQYVVPIFLLINKLIELLNKKKYIIK